MAEVGSCQDKTEDQGESLLKGREVTCGCVPAAVAEQGREQPWIPNRAPAGNDPTASLISWAG